MFGALSGGYLGGKVGPKKTIQVSCLICGLGWLLMGLAPHLSMLIIGRILCGFGASFSSANCSLLVAQYRFLKLDTSYLVLDLFHFSSLKLRGIFLSLYALMVGVGILVSYSLGAVLYWRYVALIAPVLYFIMGCLLFLTPESPIWLLGHQGEQDAVLALKWLR